MKELKRVFANQRLCVGLVMIFLINGLLFYREQTAHKYNIDLTLPSSTVSFNFGETPSSLQTELDAKKAYQTYIQWLNDYKTLPLAEATERLRQEKENLTSLLELDELIKTNGGMFGQDALAKYREEQPELIAQLEKGEIDTSQAKLDYVAVNNLLQQLTYLDSYDDFLASIQENKQNMLNFSIFNDPDTFTSRNIMKTAEDFGKLQGIPLTPGADGAIHAFLNFSLTDYLLLAVLAVVCVSFIEERKKGLWNVVHAAPNGRLRLALYRTAILLSVSIGSVLILYGTNLVIGFTIYGGWSDLGRAVQSIDVLGKLPILCSVGTFLLQYLLLRVAAAFFVALLLWLMLTAISNVKYTIVIATGVMATEYSFYAFLPVQSVLNVLKYFNIFTYISLSDLYTNYLNIDLFHFPVGIRQISLLALFPLSLCTGLACIIIHCRKKPAAGKDILVRMAYGLNSLSDKILRHFHLFGMELYKTIFIQKGLVILLLFFYLVTGLTFSVKIPVSNATEAASREYTTQLAGEITDKTFGQMDAIQEELDRSIAAYDQAKAQYDSGKMEYSQYDIFARRAEAAQIKSDGLAVVRNRVIELRNLGEKQNFTPWLLEESVYQGTYGKEAGLNQRDAAILSMLALILLIAGSISYEKQSGMNYLLASTYRGRRTLLGKKTAVAAILTALIWGTTYGLEFSTFWKLCDASTLSAAVQNLSFLAEFPIPCSIGTFLIGLYLFRYMSLFVCAMLTMLISASVKRLESACLATSSALLLPSVLYLYVGLEPMKHLSLALPIEGMCLLLPTQGRLHMFILVPGISIILLTSSVFLLKKKCKSFKRKI